MTDSIRVPLGDVLPDEKIEALRGAIERGGVPAGWNAHEWFRRLLATLDAATARALAAEEARDAAHDALWRCGVLSGMDTDGDQGPGAMLAGMGEAGYRDAMVDAVRVLRETYDECLDEPRAANRTASGDEG